MLSGPGQFAEMRQTKSISEKFHRMFCRRCACISPSRWYTNSSTEIPEFPIQPEIALELLMAANFLDC